jgi:hypothetical protein
MAQRYLWLGDFFSPGDIGGVINYLQKFVAEEVHSTVISIVPYEIWKEIFYCLLFSNTSVQCFVCDDDFGLD